VGRKEKEIRDEEEIKNIIRGCEVCRLGFAVDNAPYVVPVSFGFDGEAIFFHTGTQGKKIDCINKNSAVCFEFEREVKVLPDVDVLLRKRHRIWPCPRTARALSEDQCTEPYHETVLRKYLDFQ